MNGELPPETRIEEIKISARLGVSRTPVREALIALEQEGLVCSRPHRGFVVVRPDVALVRESYPLLSALETTALRLAGFALRDAAPRLRELNGKLDRERQKSRQYDLDRAFHATLTAACGNARLLMLLKMERARVQLFDGSHERGMANLAGSVAEHAAIVEAIDRGETNTAIDLLAAHWANGSEVVARWLSERR
ncbi:MAG: GntR family transcriptional regulator [bacterium]|nr:GntR family transcriptional regulator [bacterium]